MESSRLATRFSGGIIIAGERKHLKKQEDAGQEHVDGWIQALSGKCWSRPTKIATVGKTPVFSQEIIRKSLMQSYGQLLTH